jgi:hypothetical protein
MYRELLLFIATFTLVAPAAFGASVPKLAGTYALTVTENCQVLQINPLGIADAGKLSSSAGTVTFYTSKPGITCNAPSKPFSFSETGMKGSLYVVQGAVGTPMAPFSDSGTSCYSNSASSIALNGTNYSAAYGNIVNGVAHYVVAVGSSSAGCYTKFTMVHE